MIGGCARIPVKFREQESFRVRFDGMVVVETMLPAEPYEGPYEVTPKTEAQTLETAQKIMTEDLTVRSVPYYEVGNASGGTTVYIASEVQ